jgi:hypothetical protein
MGANSEKILDRVWPITSVDDIVGRGMWEGQIVHESALQRMPVLKRVASRLLTDLVGGSLIVKDSRAPVFAEGGETAVERTPEYLYPKFMQMSKIHWLLRTIMRARVGEVLTPGWDIQPRFKLKCRKCKKEFQNPDIKECDVCGSKRFDKPDIDQYDNVRRLLGLERGKRSLMGEGRTFNNFIYSTLWYKIALDDFYWELRHTKTFDTETQTVKRTPREIGVLDGSITFPVMNEYGEFTSTEYFCRTCYKAQRIKTGMDTFYDLRANDNRVNPNDPRCPECGEPLEQTAYIQKLSGKIVARFTKDEVIHSSADRVDPETFGMSKVVAAVKLLYVIDFYDEYNLQITSHGHANQILGIEGADKQKAEEIRAHIQNQLQSKIRRDARTGETEFSLEPIMVIIGLDQGKRIIPVDISPKLSEMQSIEFYRLYVEKVAGLFGVTPTFINIVEPGQNAQAARPNIDVQNRVTRQDMNDIENPFNDFLLPRFGITDWCLRFGKIESRDELRDKQIILTNAQAVSLLLSAGFEVDLSEDGRTFTTSNKPTNPPEARSRLEDGKIPQDLDGAPKRTMPSGEGDGVPIQEPEDDKE